MTIYLTKDWRGSHVYASEPHLLEHLPAFPPTWSGHELKCFKLAEDTVEQIPDCRHFITRQVWWSLVNMRT